MTGEKYTYVLKERLYTLNVEVDDYSSDLSGGDLNFTINSIYTPPGKDAIDNQWTVWVSPDNADISWLGVFSQLGGSGGLNQERTLKIGTAPYNVSGANCYDKDLYNADSITNSLIRDLS